MNGPQKTVPSDVYKCVIELLASLPNVGDYSTRALTQSSVLHGRSPVTDTQRTALQDLLRLLNISREEFAARYEKDLPEDFNYTMLTSWVNGAVKTAKHGYVEQALKALIKATTTQ